MMIEKYPRSTALVQQLRSSISNTVISKFSLPSRKTRILAGGALFLAACAFGAAGIAPAAMEPDLPPVSAILQDLPTPDMRAQIAALDQHPQLYINEERVRAGDNLASLLQRLGVDDDDAARFIRTDPLASTLMRLKPGRSVLAQTDDEGRLLQLSTTVITTPKAPARGDKAMASTQSEVSNLVISRNGQQFTVTKTALQLERRVEMRSGTVRSSLFAATDAAQVPDAVAAQLVDTFSGSVNFVGGLQRGDRFTVVYETFWQNGAQVRTGRMLASEFVNAGNTYNAIWYDPADGRQSAGYYTGNGKSLKKAFLKTPLAYTRISSGFSMRLHPISGQWKQHKGVDFAAPTGTPIRASADGVVDFVGKQNGYGNLVVLKHWASFSTAYGHMSRMAPGLHAGDRVAQGQVIGYVGSTGWATGPHLHYEFRVAGEPRDPLSLEVPSAQPLTVGELQQFNRIGQDMNRRLALLRTPVQQAAVVKIAKATNGA